MDLRLDLGNWYLNGYVINGDRYSGYDVYYEDDFDDSDLNDDEMQSVYSSSDFESAITWCYNS